MHPHSRNVKNKSADGLAQRMCLQDRKAFRLEMVYQSIRETFSSIAVAAHMYKLKVMPLDDRHHRFAVMIDVAKSFFTSKEVGAKLFPALEQMMRANAYKRFRVGIDGIYWRICETEDQFERGARVGDSAGAQNAVPVIHSDSSLVTLPLRVQPHIPTDSAERDLPAREAGTPSGARVKTVSLDHSAPMVHRQNVENQSSFAQLSLT